MDSGVGASPVVRVPQHDPPGEEKASWSLPVPSMAQLVHVARVGTPSRRHET